MQLDAFAYDLPDEAIAQIPLAIRDSSRLLDATVNPPQHRHVRDFSQLVRPGDVIVVNNTRVLPARLHLRKPSGGAVEVFLLQALDSDDEWEALVRPSRKVPPGTILSAAGGEPLVVAGADLGEGRRRVRAASDLGLTEVADAHGQVPTPPYIHAALADPERYQTVYAEREVSVAAPTAGLHFTPELLAACESAGATVHRLELAVGIGTFRPIVVDDLAEHTMHAERYAVSDATWQACEDAERVVAIGTTTVRALESAATTGERAGTTSLFITPGYEWKMVDAMLTNFHQPRSSLLIMLAAFMGPSWRDIYALALRNGYRFLSFGDAMFVARSAS